MENVMNPEEFYLKLKENLNAIIDIEKVYHDNTKWTKTIKDLTESMLCTQNISREYYRIDSLEYAYTEFYKNFNENYHKKTFYGNNGDKYYLNVYNWKNVYAIEYENDCHSWTDELIKLSHIRSDLKVIIAYSEWLGDKENYLSLIKHKMDFALELLKGCEEESLKDSWLIVFGPCKGGKEYDKYLVDCFVGYEMKDGNFVKIEE